jgi:hypothetical protein
MKKIIFLLLLISTTFSYGQTTLANKLKITGNVEDITATKVAVQTNDGLINWRNVLDIRGNGTILSTGLIKNGLISANGDPTKFNITAGIGIISNFDDPENPISTLVNFPAFTGITPTYLLTGTITYVAINSTPSVVMQATPFTPEQRRSLIVLGAVVHSNLTTINVINNISAPSNASTNQLHDFIEAVGALNLTGNKYTANGANLQLNKSAGLIFKLGSNFANDWKNPHELAQTAGTSLTFRYITQNGTEGSDRINLDPALYDLNNVLTSVPNNKFTIQTVTMFQSGVTRIQYGQNYYDDLSSAKNAIFLRNFVLEPNSKDNGIIRAYIIMRNTTTSLQAVADADILEAQKFGGVASGGVAITMANIISGLGYTPENVANKQNSLAVDGTGNKYATVDAINEALPTTYTKIVYVNDTTPTTATIFDLENPPLINDNALKNDVNNLYIGTDASTWVYITSPAGYVTKTVSSETSNFYLSGTTTDAGNSKTASISRDGKMSINGPPVNSLVGLTVNGNMSLANSSIYGVNLIQGTSNGIGDLKLSSNTITLASSSTNFGRMFSTGNFVFQNGGTFTDNTVDRFQIDGSILATSFKKVGGLSTEFLMADGSVSLGGGGSGDMVLATAQTVTGEKTFLDTKLSLRNVANTFSSYFTNTNTAIRTYTLQNKTGTIAQTDDYSVVPLNEGNGIGHVINGRTAANYGSVGFQAVDLSNSDGASGSRGATGYASIAGGANTTASGNSAVAFGNGNTSSGPFATVGGGFGNTASGNLSAVIGGDSNQATGAYSLVSGGSGGRATGAYSTVVGGLFNRSRSYGEICAGLFGTDYTPISTTTWQGLDRLYNLGNGTDDTIRTNALTILKNGLATLPSVTNTLISGETTGKAIVTKSWVPEQLKDFYADVNNISTTETDLLTYTTVANRLNATGEKLISNFAGTFNDVTASSQLKIYFAGQNIGDTGALTMSVTGAWVTTVSIIRTGTTTGRAVVNISTPGASTAAYTKYTSLTGLTFTGANIVKITGTAGGATGGNDDITATYGNIIWQPASL